MAQCNFGELDIVFASVMNFQGDPRVTLTTLNTRGQYLCVPHLLAGQGDTEGMEFTGSGQLCFE